MIGTEIVYNDILKNLLMKYHFDHSNEYRISLLFEEGINSNFIIYKHEDSKLGINKNELFSKLKNIGFHISEYKFKTAILINFAISREKVGMLIKEQREDKEKIMKRK